jgi:hypothetical protein
MPLMNVLSGMLLGVVGHGDALVTRQRADEDVRVLLLHQAARLLDRLVGGVVAQP